MQYLIYFSKRMLFALVYALVMIMICLSITMIDDNKLWLKYLLYAGSFVIYALVVVAVAYRDGQEAVKVRHVNDVERMNIIRTGEDRPLNLAKEYKPWKGFVSGFAVCVPMIFLMLLQSVFFLASPENPPLWAGAIASYIYIIFFSFIRPNNVAYTSVPLAYNYYYLFLAIPVFMLLLGIPYLLGAKKQMLIYARVEDKHKQIYGENE